MKLVSLLLAALALPVLADERPNILLMFADDWGRYGSAYRNPDLPSPNDVVKTPVFDRMAREGALFQSAHVSAPSCTPSRASLFTGRHFFRNSSHSQLHHPWPKGEPDSFDAIKGMPVTLQEAGYHIGLSYKLHVRESLMGGKANLYNRPGNQLGGYSEVVSVAKDRPAAREKIYEEVRQNFRDFLAKRKKGQPFFYAFHPTNTHRPWVRGSGKELWGLNPDDLKGKLPAVMPDVPVLREDFADYLGEGMAFDAACGVLVEMLEEMGELDNTIVVISGDHGVPGFPRGKCNVHDLGSEVLLAMRWPKGIAAERDVKVPVSLIDLTPTFLAAAGVKGADDMDGENLLPALAVGGDDTKLRGWVLIGREVHCRRGEVVRAGGLPYPVRAVRTDEFLYIRNFKTDRWPLGTPAGEAGKKIPTFEELAKNTYAAVADIDASPSKAWLVLNQNEAGMEKFVEFAWGKRPEEELYEVKKDPWQMKNLAASPEHQEVLKKLREKLTGELQAKKDPRLDDAFDRAPYLHDRNK
ncbi:MAG: sulfatase [Verrucomicrobiales bacterium]